MITELLIYITLISILNGVLVPMVIDTHIHVYKTIDTIKKEYWK